MQNLVTYYVRNDNNLTLKQNIYRFLYLMINIFLIKQSCSLNGI